MLLYLCELQRTNGITTQINSVWLASSRNAYAYSPRRVALFRHVADDNSVVVGSATVEIRVPVAKR
jgi:hypothetical protein